MTYKRELVEQLLPAVWDCTYAYGMANPTAPDPDMPRAKADPKLGGTLYAHLADIRSAWEQAPLSHDERVALLLRYGLDWTQSEIGAARGVNKSTICRRLERAVGVLAAHLNGDDYEDPDETVQV